jgi:hypothetical protein
MLLLFQKKNDFHRMKTLSVFLLISWLHLGTLAQKITRSNYTISLSNSTANAVNVQIGPNLNSLYNVKIPANDNWISPLSKSNQVIVLSSKIGKSSVRKNYNLQPGKQYILFWNNNALDIRSK